MLPAVRGYCEALQCAVRRECTADFPSDRAVEVMDRLDAMRAFVYTGAVGTTLSESLGEDSTLSPRLACQNFMRDLGVDNLLADVLRHSCTLLRKQWHLADPHRRARLLAAEEHALHGRSEQVRLRGEEELAVLLAQTPLAVVAQGGGEQEEGDGSLLQAPVNRPGRLVCELAYEVLLHMVRRNRTIAVRLAKHLEELQQQLALRVGAEQLMREILGRLVSHPHHSPTPFARPDCHCRSRLGKQCNGAYTGKACIRTTGPLEITMWRGTGWRGNKSAVPAWAGARGEAIHSRALAPIIVHRS